jgi:hypothetical protein
MTTGKELLIMSQPTISEIIDKQQCEIDRLRNRLAEIREVWAGAEVGEPVYAQEAYAIRLCKQMYDLACDALYLKIIS